MDRQVRAFLNLVNGSPQPPIDTIPIAQARQQFASLTPFFHPTVPVDRVLNLTTRGGVRLRAYYPPNGEDGHRPAIIYFHGGGWVLGDLDTHDSLCRHLAISANSVVVAVDYRLAPECPFPAAFDDAWAALHHVVEEAEDLGIDVDRLAVAGDSAGGNLATAVSLRARGLGAPYIAFQCLIYPALDVRSDSGSYREFADGYGLTRDRMRFFWKSYQGLQTNTDPMFSPAQAENLAGLPPTLILTAEYDVLRDEGESYADRLRTSGVPVELMRVDGVIHGFVHYAGAIECGQRVLTAIGRKMALALARTSGHH